MANRENLDMNLEGNDGQSLDGQTDASDELPNRHSLRILNILNADTPVMRPQMSGRAGDVAHEIANTIDDAFGLIERGAEAEDDGRYKQAIRSFLDGGEMLEAAAEQETSPRVKQLLLHKAHEVLGWCESLALWLETHDRQYETTPPRISHSVGVEIDCGYECPELEFQEATTMYYTPVACEDPSQFTFDGYRLQVTRMQRHPTLMAVITMYNEDAEELRSTLRKVCNNIQYLRQKSLPGYIDEKAWQRVLVCIVSDGRSKINASALNYLASIGLFDEDVMSIASTGVNTHCHLFERTVQLEKSTSRKTSSQLFPPLQLLFALKEHNRGKLHSHLWYFNAFAEQIQPDYTVLLDVGTMPTKSAFYKLLSALEINPQIGGVCGEIAVDRPIPNLWNIVIAAQHFEYKISNILDKAMESCFGFISVLPGAFSAYRYKAIRGAPLAAYFKSLTHSAAELGPFESNMYLAEDRILCFELLARKHCNWTMHYVKNAIARTDVPKNLIDLIAQRRRWLNGSFFAALFVLNHWGRIYTESSHGVVRKTCLMIQFFYNCLQTLFSWLLPSTFYLAIYYIVFHGFEENEWNFVDTSDVDDFYISLMKYGFNGLYGVLVFTQITYGLGNKPKHVRCMYYMTAFLLGIGMLAASGLTILIYVSDATLSLQAVLLVVMVFGFIFVGAALHCELHHIVLSIIQYFAMIPVFVNILAIYSFCNLNDISWGTKGIDTGHHAATGKTLESSVGTYAQLMQRRKALDLLQKKKAREADAVQRRFDGFRTNTLHLWLFSNLAVIFGCVYFVPANYFLAGLFLFVGFFNTFKLVGSICYLLYRSRQWFVFNCLLCCGVLRKRQERRESVHVQRQSQLVELNDIHQPRAPSGSTAAAPYALA